MAQTSGLGPLYPFADSEGLSVNPVRIQSHNVATILGVTPPRAVREMALREDRPSAALIGGQSVVHRNPSPDLVARPGASTSSRSR